MLRIRLSRTGKKKQASYRIVVTDVRNKRDGRIVERIGHYNPLPNPMEFNIEEARALHWLKSGAQPSDAVLRLLEKQGTMGRLKRLHAGESIEALVAEFEGREYPAAEVEEEGVVAQAVAAVSEAVETAGEAVAEVVAEVVEAVAGEEEE